MISDLLNIENFISSYFDLTIYEQLDWESIKKLQEGLKLANEYVLKLQREDLTYYEAYIEWIFLEFCLEELKETNDFAQYLLDEMKVTKCNIFENDLIKTSLFLDLRYKHMINNDEVDLIYKTIKGIYYKLKCLQKTEAQETLDDDQENKNQEKNNTYDKNAIRLSFLNTISKFKYSPVIKLNTLSELDTELKYYKELNVVTENNNILNIWVSLKHKLPILYDVASVVFSIPCTQVSVERAFSVFNYCYGDRRTAMNKELLGKLICIKLNEKIRSKIGLKE